MAKKYYSQTGELYKKDIPKMPEGYYSGDKPNPNLRTFVEDSIGNKPYDSERDTYCTEPFTTPLEASKSDPLYALHGYWSKKSYQSIRHYIEHYTSPEDIVLDPMCGSGSTALATLLEGRRAIAIDASPFATFLTSHFCAPVNIQALREDFDQLLEKCKSIRAMCYQVTCHRCGGPAEIVSTIISEKFRCERCFKLVYLYTCRHDTKINESGLERNVWRCPECDEPINTREQKHGADPVESEVLCLGKCRPKRARRSVTNESIFFKQDLQKITTLLQEFQTRNINYPQHRMMNAPDNIKRWGILYGKGTGDLQYVNEIFTARNLFVLAEIKKHITEIQNETLLFLWSSILFKCSHLMALNNDGIGRVMKGTYYIAPMRKEMNPFYLLLDSFPDIVRGLEVLNAEIRSTKLLVSTQDARDLSGIPSNSIDYIFTDPPYTNKVPFGELNFTYEAWLGFRTEWLKDEIIVTEERGFDENYWAQSMLCVVRECFRVLKPGRWLSLCYHDTSTGAWEALQDLMTMAGFVPDKNDSPLHLDTKQKSIKQLTSKKVIMRDLVINFRKPKHGELTSMITLAGDEDETTFNEKVRQIIRDYIGVNPGCTKDRIYDAVVSCMVRSGRMEAHDFNELLGHVAEEAKVERGKGQDGRWYLKETELVVADAAENAREDTAADMIGAFIKTHLKKNPSDEGVRYSDLFEYYFYAVKDKPRRQLVDFLPDYFYKTEHGTLRLPVTDEEERAKREARVKGLGRRVKRYIAQLEQGAVIPDHERPNEATLAEWIRHCKRAGQYEQGKLLYEKGGLNLNDLPDEAMVNVEEDYQICVRMLSRAFGGVTDSKQKRSRSIKT
ncbi:MAG: DNA methyltransferase [Parcubacteria group bacterium]